MAELFSAQDLKKAKDGLDVLDRLVDSDNPNFTFDEEGADIVDQLRLVLAELRQRRKDADSDFIFLNDRIDELKHMERRVGSLRRALRIYRHPGSLKEALEADTRCRRRFIQRMRARVAKRREANRG